jgi:hypothetical protein
MKLADLPADQRRLLTLHARSTAVLRLGDARILKLEALKLATDDPEEAGRLAARQVFVDNLWHARRMASGQPIYETVDGMHCIMRAPVDTDDRRIVAIQQLARELRISESDLDAETIRILDAEEADRARSDEIVAEFMSKLPRPRRWPRTDLSLPMSTRRRHPNYDATALKEVVARLPDHEPNGAEQLELERRLLGDLDEHLRADTPVDDTRARAVEDSPTRRAALLRAATEFYDARSSARSAAVKAKSKALASHPSGGDRVAYSARNTDLDAELIQPIREDLDDVGELVIRYAVRLEPSRNWPPGNTKLDRALALGRTVAVEDLELATARASLGYASMGARGR